MTREDAQHVRDNILHYVFVVIQIAVPVVLAMTGAVVAEVWSEIRTVQHAVNVLERNYAVVDERQTKGLKSVDELLVAVTKLASQIDRRESSTMTYQDFMSQKGQVDDRIQAVTNRVTKAEGDIDAINRVILRLESYHAEGVPR